MQLFAAERFVLCTVIILFVFDVALITIKGIKLDYVGYFLCGMAGIGVFALGQFYRNSGRDLHIAAALISSGLFILFSLVGAVFNYMFLPVSFPAIDPVLIRVDRALGYSWPDMVTWAATYPWLGKMLFLVYTTSLPQLLLIIVALGFTGKDRMLHHFIVTGVMGAMASIIFWIFFPTYGAKAYYELPEWVTQAIPLMVNPAYGRELMRLGQEGVTYLSPKDVLGLIGFPSFHIFMAAMSVWFVPRHRLVIAVILPLNLLMLPAVLVQGGHHLSDVFGGLIAFAVVCAASGRLLDWLSARERMGRAVTVPA
ncbi:phosphatase PAP2 family protein [Agrobacterium tumefaciens]|uniref:phosphatase PAP2 family protein n=1 Tax=Agrobacterium tumefaciens TaxID=358 RepID=UPI001573A33F|nr:phosphatase PAP2 family protein [Agrobacterium tumefaciens]WCK03187.1 phosphatase PAP2 family protein [Agrobacterium tumefaciens]